MSERTNGSDDPIINFEGEKVALGPFRREFLPLYTRWINDFAVAGSFMQRLKPVTEEARSGWYEQASRGGPGVVDFLIYEKETMRPIGYASLDSIDYFSRTATYGVLLGEKECWGRGYGTEATRLMLDYAFTILGLHNVGLTVAAFNQRGIHSYERAGFRICGRRREAWRFGETFHDLISMECLSNDFKGSRFEEIVPREVVDREQGRM